MKQDTHRLLRRPSTAPCAQETARLRDAIEGALGLNDVEVARMRTILSNALGPETVQCSNMRGHKPHPWSIRSTGRLLQCPGREGGDV